MILYTIQPPEALDIITREGTFSCDSSKSVNYKDYHDAYLWLVKQMDKKGIYHPEHLELPLWAWYKMDGSLKKDVIERETKFSEAPGTECVLIEFAVPDDQVLLSDFDFWHCVLNNSPILDPNDYLDSYEEYEVEYDKYMSLPEYCRDLIKENSWNNIFNIDNSDYIQATFWELKAKDIISVSTFITKELED